MSLKSYLVHQIVDIVTINLVSFEEKLEILEPLEFVKVDDGLLILSVGDLAKCFFILFFAVIFNLLPLVLSGFPLLDVGFGLEEVINDPWKQSLVFFFPDNGVGLAGVGDSVGEDHTTFVLVESVGNHRKTSVAKNFFLATLLAKDFREIKVLKLSCCCVHEFLGAKEALRGFSGFEVSRPVMLKEVLPLILLIFDLFASFDLKQSLLPSCCVVSLVTTTRFWLRYIWRFSFTVSNFFSPL